MVVVGRSLLRVGVPCHEEQSGVGTGFEAFMVLGDGLYVICNNTQASMTEISKDPKWINAQVPFAELSDRVRANPLAPSV